MASITLKGEPVETAGSLPVVGSQAPDFTLTAADLSEKSLAEFRGKKVVLNIFVSLDTGICANSVRRFNADAGGRDDTVVLCISGDLPFAHGRFCETEGLKDVVSLSAFRYPDFGKDYGVAMTTGPLRGLLSRSVLILDEEGMVVYSEQVPEIGQDPDYDGALGALEG